MSSIEIEKPPRRRWLAASLVFASVLQLPIWFVMGVGRPSSAQIAAHVVVRAALAAGVLYGSKLACWISPLVVAAPVFVIFTRSALHAADELGAPFVLAYAAALTITLLQPERWFGKFFALVAACAGVFGGILLIKAAAVLIEPDQAEVALCEQALSSFAQPLEPWPKGEEVPPSAQHLAQQWEEASSSSEVARIAATFLSEALFWCVPAGRNALIFMKEHPGPDRDPEVLKRAVIEGLAQCHCQRVDIPALHYYFRRLAPLPGE